jgi:flagellar hook-length control protein FliK
LSSFPASSLQFPGFPPGFLAQAEALFGGSLEDAVTRLQDGAVPAENVAALRSMFSALLAQAGEGDAVLDPRSLGGSASMSMPAVHGGTDHASTRMGLYAELPADMLAALGLPPAGEILPDDAPGGFMEATTESPVETVVDDLIAALPLVDTATVPAREVESYGAEVEIRPDGQVVVADGGAADALVAESADSSRDAGSDMLAATSTLSTERSAATPEGLLRSSPAPAAATAVTQHGATADSGDAIADAAPYESGLMAAVTRAPGEGAASVRSALAAQEAANLPVTEASSNSVSAAAERMAALLAEIDSLDAGVEALDEAQLREAMQRIDFAMQALRGGTAQDAETLSPAGLDDLAARLLAAGDDAERRAAVLQEFRQQLAASGEAAPVAAAPAASSPSAPASGTERPQTPGLPLSLPLNHERWAEEVGERVRWIVGQQMQTAELKITPANLGTIEVRITMHKDQMQISFASPHAAVREVLEDAAPRLREMMSAAGYSAVNVDISHQQPQRHGEGGFRHWAGSAPWGEEPERVEQSTGTIAPRLSGALDCYA